MKVHQIPKAFSLIEVLIFVVVFSLLFITAAAIVTSTLRVTKENQNKIKASHFVEELREWLRSEKETNWGGSVYVGSVNSFTEQVTQSSPTTSFCFNSSPISAWPSTGTSNCNFTLDGQFRRIATFSATVVNGFVNQISANISTEWKNGEEIRLIPLQSVFSIWE
jgi:Tfp pilus assembly protein PilV